MGGFNDGHIIIVSVVLGFFVLCIYLGSSFWVFFDAKRIVKETGTEKVKPLFWLIACLAIWIVAYPIYVYNRGGLARTIGLLILLPLVIFTIVFSKIFPIPDELNSNQDIFEKDVSSALVDFISQTSGVWQSEHAVMTLAQADRGSLSVLYRPRSELAKLIYGQNLYHETSNLDLDVDNKQLVVTILSSPLTRLVIRQIWNSSGGFSLVVLNESIGEEEYFSFIRNVDRQDIEVLTTIKTANKARSSSEPNSIPATVTPVQVPPHTAQNVQESLESDRRARVLESIAATAPTTVSPEIPRGQELLPSFNKENDPQVSLSRADEPNVLISTEADNSGPSFNCLNKLTSVEKLICNDPALSKLDMELSAAYVSVLKASMQRNESEDIKASQRVWLKNVRNRCASKDCLKKAYENRIIEIFKI